MCRHARVFSIDNVVAYWYQSPSTGMVAHDFPNVAPPFPFFFFEWANTATAGNPVVVKQVGVLFVTFDCMDESTINHCPLPPKDGYRWRMVSIPVMQNLSGEVIFSSWAFTYLVDPHGSVETTEEEIVGGVYNYVDHSVSPDDAALQWLTTLMHLSIHPSFLALSFLHCKNVQTAEHRPNKKESSRHRRIYGVPLTKHYTLEIDPMKKILRTEGQSDTLGLKRSLSICRGHFSEYGPEFGKGKLFGKLEGRFWIPQHVKGSAEYGTVEKDYTIKAPEVHLRNHEQNP